MPQEDKSLNDINKRLKSTLENQVDVIESSTKNLISNITSSNSRFTNKLDIIKGNILDSIQKATSGGKLDLEIDKKISLSSLMGDMSKMDNLNIALALKFLKVKNNILKSIDKATNGGNLDIDIDSSMKLSELLGESPKLNLVHAFRWLRIKKNILGKVEAATEGVELEIDNKMSLNDILGSTPDQDIITKTRFFLIRQRLLNKISKAAKDFDPQESVDSITGGVSGGAPGASNEAIPSVLNSISEPIISSSESLKTLVENSSGDVLQQRENRREDIARQERQIQALNSISDNDNQVNGSESAGGGIGGAMAGIGKGAGKGISGFLTGLGEGLKAISNPKYLIGAGVLIALGGALLVTGKALKEFVGIDFKQVALGVTTLGVLGAGAALLGNLGGQILIGSLAIAALGASLIPAAFAFNMFSDINWKSVAIGIGTLTALGAAAFGLSFISPAIFIGAAAIAALGAAMIPAAFAFNLFGSALGKITPFISAFGNAISTVISAVGDFLTGFIDSLVQLSSAGPGLIIAGAGIAAVSAALIAFGASSAIGGLLSFFGGDPIEKFLELADKSSGLDASAKAIDSIALSLEKLDSDKIDDMTDSFKGFVKQLKNLSKLKLKDAAMMFKFMAKASGVDVSEQPVSAEGISKEDNLNVVKTEESANVKPLNDITSNEARPLKVEVVKGVEEKPLSERDANKQSLVKPLNDVMSTESKPALPSIGELFSRALGIKDKATADLEAFEGDSSKKFSMVKNEYGNTVKRYDNDEDHKRYLELQSAKSDAEWEADQKRGEYLAETAGGDTWDYQDRFSQRVGSFNSLQMQDALTPEEAESDEIDFTDRLDQFVRKKFPVISKIQELKKKSLSIRENVDPIDNSSGAQLERNQREILQMKEAESLQAASSNTETIGAIVNKAGDQNITNTTINSDRHIDRTMDLIPAF